MMEKTHADFLEICRKYHWKCTSQRLAVFDFLKDNLTHPDVDSVWTAVRKNLPAITRESVYRILNEFAENAVICRLDQIENARYDSRTDAHGHFICQNCGKISDFNWPEGVTLPQNMISGEVAHMEIRVVGLCPECCPAADPPVPKARSKE